ncbi:unnamed protein product [Caenorhabditis brenneri]
MASTLIILNLNYYSKFLLFEYLKKGHPKEGRVEYELRSGPQGQPQRTSTIRRLQLQKNPRGPTKIPSYRRKEFLFWGFFDYKIPYARAAWVTKFCEILNFHNASNSTKKSLLDVATLEMSQSSNRFIVYMISKLYKVDGTCGITPVVAFCTCSM